MNFIKEIIINSPINEVWEILGTQFGEVHKWASGINYSESFGTPQISEANCNNRSCELPSGKIKEVIKKFNTNSYTLEYEVIEGFPFFIETAINKWQLIDLNEKTKVNMYLSVKTKGLIGSIMGPMLKMQFNGLANTALNDLKYFVETGKPSQKKVKEIEKISKKVA